MRIISWNVNGIRAVEKKGFLDWLHRESPDILCINETRAEPGQIPPKLVNPQGYHSAWASAKKRGYSGVAIYSKVELQNARFMGKAAFDDEGRVLAVDFKNFTLIAAYFPNAQDAGARLDYKLAFCAEMLKLCKSLVKKGRHILLCGDYNIAHTPIDLAHPKANEGNAGYLPEERAWMDTFTRAGYVDTFRHFYPGEIGQYTWWSYRHNARRNNVGWRIDYHCVDSAFLPRVKSSIIRPDVTGSDHCPVEIVLED
jgi:exodeoxyribonuclease-3